MPGDRGMKKKKGNNTKCIGSNNFLINADNSSNVLDSARNDFQSIESVVLPVSADAVVSDLNNLGDAADVMALRPPLPDKPKNASIPAAFTGHGESNNIAQLKTIFSSFKNLIDNFDVNANVLDDSNALNAGVARAWLNSPSASPLIPMQSAATICVEPPIPPHSSVVPDNCLREVMTCELSPLGFHLNIAVKEKIWRGDYIELLSLLPLSRDFKFDKSNDKFEDDKRKSPP